MQPHVKYELTNLEKMISSDTIVIPPSSSVKDVVNNEVERIKQTFIHEVFTFEDERHLERYIQYHQQGLIRIMDRLDMASPPDDSTHPESYKVFYGGLEDLLTFIERHFSKYFDQDAHAPQGYIAIAKKEARNNLKRIQKSYEGKEVDINLLDLLLNILKKVIQCDPDLGITYRRVIYAKEVQKELLLLIKQPLVGLDLSEELRQIMYYLNYNSTKVLTYHAHFITSILDKSETRAEKIERLSYLLKRINQAQVKPGIRYHPNGPSLKDQLNIYISEEIDYQERLQHLSGTGSQNSSNRQLPGFQIKFDASVAQLAYLIRILLETKTILNNNLTQVFHFLVKYIITKRSEVISYGSFRAKFYAVESGTKESVRNMLISWINYIDKN